MADTYECAQCHEDSVALWACPSCAVAGTCEECGREGQYVEAVTRLCRSCFWCEWPTDKPEPSGTTGHRSTEEV